MTIQEAHINTLIDNLGENGKSDNISDGYHTFGELYKHRIALYIALCKALELLNSAPATLTNKTNYVWRSKKHSDGSSFDGWFILGVNYKGGGKQVSYHLPMSKWDETDFVFNTLEFAPEWDGHTSSDVLNRLSLLV